MIKHAVFSWKHHASTLSLSHSRIWAGSVHYAKRDGMRCVLVADKPGVAYLHDGLGLPFDEVRPLPELPAELVHIYDLVKLSALLMFASDGVPAMHVDHDAFLRRPLPERILSAPFAGEFFYEPAKVIRELHDSFPLRRFEAIPPKGLAGGIMGGNSCRRISEVCLESLRIALDPRNREAMRAADGYQASTIIGELAFGEAFPDAEQLFPNGPKAQTDYYRLGYMHAADLKKNPGVRCEMLEFFRDEFPAEFAKTRARWDSCFPPS